MTSNQVAYDFLQTTLSRQLVTVYDLYGLLGVSPTADEQGIKAAYEKLSHNLLPAVPTNVVNVAYSILVNPFKRAQYDRDRLEYLYKNFSTHENFPQTSTANASLKDEVIQVYAITLMERVQDPIEEKKSALIHKINRVRNEIEEFNETSLNQRQNWVTSSNKVMRMAGSALCEVVVVAEEDLRRLEDELGRLDGILGPEENQDARGGRRITSAQFGSEFSDTSKDPHNIPFVLRGQAHPSIPGSPTMRLRPTSVSKTGMPTVATGTEKTDGMKDSSECGHEEGNDGSEATTEIWAEDRVNNFLAGPGNIHFKGSEKQTTTVQKTAGDTTMQDITIGYLAPKNDAAATTTGITNKTINVKINNDTKPLSGWGAPNKSALDRDWSASPIPAVAGTGMGLIEYQRVHGLRNPENLENDPVWALRHTSTSSIQAVPKPDPTKMTTTMRRDFSAGAGGAATGPPKMTLGWVGGAGRKGSKRVRIAGPKAGGGGEMDVDDPFV